MRRLAYLCLVVLLITTACGSGTPAAPALTPPKMIENSITLLRAQTTFRLIVEHQGAPYFIPTGFGEAELKRASGQYVAPNRIGAKVKVLVGKLPIEADVYTVDTAQYLRGVWTNNAWLQDELVSGFDARLILSAEDNGFTTALRSLQNLQKLENTTLEDGTAVYHLQGQGDGANLSALVVNLISMVGNVTVDIFVDQATGLPVRFIALEHESVSAATPEPRTWTIDLYDFGQPDELDGPRAEATPEATAATTATAEG